MVNCGCAIPDEAFEGIEENIEIESVEDRLAKTGQERPDERQ